MLRAGLRENRSDFSLTCCDNQGFIHATLPLTINMESTCPPPTAAHKAQLFWLSVLALVTAGIGSALRTNIAHDLQINLFDPIDKLQSASMVGNALGLPFLGFAMVIAVGSPLLDYIGMGRLLMLSSFCFLAGTSIVVFSRQLEGVLSLYHTVCAGMFITGLGWGLVETVINPLAATLYPEDKTSRLNILHAWWPGGLIMGGLIGLALSGQQVRWEWQLAVVMVPALVFGIMAITEKFPPTERVAAGVSAKSMWSQAVQPLFIVFFLCMFLTAASELAPGSWVDLALTLTVGMKGIWLLVYVSGLMFVMRHFAGPLAHRLSPVGLLWLSCMLASLGLILLSYANSKVTGLLAATVWGIGVCYMWPTMLGSASERFPRGGALLIGLMGTGGTLSVFFVLPQMGKIYDYAKIKEAGGAAAFEALKGPQLDAVLAHAGQFSFRVVAALPACLLLVFGAIWLRDRAKGGYKPEKLQR
jgi:fucose permease